MMADKWAIKPNPIGEGTADEGATDRSMEFRAHLIRQIEQCLEASEKLTWHPSCEESLDGRSKEPPTRLGEDHHDRPGITAPRRGCAYMGPEH